MASFLGTIDTGGEVLQYLASNLASNSTGTLKELGDFLTFSKISSTPSPAPSLSSVSSGSSNSLSSLSSSTKPQEPEFLILSGSSFSGMVGKTDYKSTRNVIVDYDVLFVRKQLHWLLLMRMVDSELSFVTIGITTTNLQDCVPTMRRLSTPTTSICTTHLNGDWSVPLLTCEPEAVGKYRGRLADICEVADSVWKTWRSTICLPITVSILLTTCSISWDSKHTRVGPQISVDMTNEEREFDLLSTVIKN